MGVVNALLGDGDDALVGEKKLLNRPVGWRVSTIGRIPLEVRTVKGRDPSLCTVSYDALEAGRVRTYSHGCCLSIAVLGSCQKRMSIWVRQGDAVLGAAVERLLALEPLAMMCFNVVVLRRKSTLPHPNPPPWWARVSQCSASTAPLRHASGVCLY